MVEQAYLDYEAIKYFKGAGSKEGREAYGVWADALDAYNAAKKAAGEQPCSH